jgi:hypothetical protein
MDFYCQRCLFLYDSDSEQILLPAEWRLPFYLPYLAHILAGFYKMLI